ncbi:1-acyl-sn-glycerol-3-phosphate acyltransferase [Ulvibacter litoralis]|uniref:1-acyl-sn-glycerol-3-phosphate acyltransferases n=1 Tax=Ulvibacter litoralis TaxID=227084 RepID=A0A1G7FSD8_9FLAO|nr:1-acyl-sn-glycerol-3-phosphate acyltransferase [Ulvibacter litoralis]GHC63662.1 acyltransferase [Ulvibacter litoralis]SDE78827.1 1-acyl-sn-glycerol-3-phosphate acyltransferases [Ulvibacter litoralis]
MSLTKFIYHKILGWKFQGDFDRSIKKSVLIVVPHTSYVDFVLSILVRRILKIQINFVGKKELFKAPFGWYFKWMGGEPLNREKAQNKVEAIANVFAEHEEFRLAIAPEGTRKKVDAWKTGYYYIALAANVPIIPIGLDYSTKIMHIGEAFYPTGNIEEDEKFFRNFFKGMVGKVPEYT